MPLFRSPCALERSAEHRRLCVTLTLSALAGLGALALSIVALLSFALWLGCSVAVFWWPLSLAVAVAVLGLAVLLLSWLWLPPPEVAGVELDRRESPALFRLIDLFCEIYGVRPIDRLLVGADMNASVIQVPELGLWGRLQTTLVIGLPLLHSVSAIQLQSILAHELSHIALQRGPYAAWAAQLRAWWHRVLSAVAEDTSPLGRLCWLGLQPHADRYLLAAMRLSHLEEFEADAAAARLVGAEPLAEALIEVALKERYLREEYWDAVMSQFEYPEHGAPVLPFRTMGVGLALGFRRVEAAGQMQELLALDEAFELHPSLVRRLAALQVGPHSLVASSRSAADRYLGETANRLACRLDRAWCMALAPFCD